MRQGFDVTGVDTGYYRAGWLYNPAGASVKTLNKDLREIVSADFAGIDAVVHMAELSNDPAGDLAPHITYEINHKGSVRLAELAKAAGVRRFVYMSSCSVYGVGTDAYVDETTPTGRKRRMRSAGRSSSGT
jgi:nucleoside-diphosphate-sugar epimerase